MPKAVVEASDLQRRLQQAAQQYHASTHKGKTTGSYKNKPWATGLLKSALDAHRNMPVMEFLGLDCNGISGVRLRYGKTHPPANTICNWAKALASDRYLQNAGRPSALSSKESRLLMHSGQRVCLLTGS